jgi:hypothetical protein
MRWIDRDAGVTFVDRMEEYALAWRQREEQNFMFKQMSSGTKKSLLHGKQLYKVVVNGRSVHGGSFDYANYLPTKNADGTYTPGGWTPEIAAPVVCRTGYHLTTDPFVAWAAPGMSVYEAEGRGAYSADGRDTLRITDNKIAFAQVRLTRPVDTNLQAAKAVIAEVGAIPFLSGGGYARPNWSVFGSEREASAAFQADGGGKGYPAAPKAGLDPDQVAELEGAADALYEAIPAAKQYATDAFPGTLAFCLAKWKLSGQPVPAELTERLGAYKAGFGVAGRTADGTLYVFRSY